MSLDSSTERWLINGVSLSQYGWAVKTFGGSPRSLPLMRGDNIGVAYIPGRLFRQKFPDQRVITLLMWAAGIVPTTGKPSSNVTLQFSDNFRTLQQLFYNPSTPLNITREWYFTQNGTPTLVSATATGQAASDMEPTMTGQGRADFSVDLILNDPYFYGSAVTPSIPYNVATNVTNFGDDAVAYNNFTITLHGPLLYPRLTNSTNSAWLSLNTLISSGDSIVIDVENYTAVRSSDGADMRSIITHSASRRWFQINTGVNSLILTSSLNTDTGTAGLSFQPPYV